MYTQSDVEAFARSLAILYEYCQSRVVLDQIKIKFKKTTNAGWFFETTDGQCSH